MTSPENLHQPIPCTCHILHKNKLITCHLAIAFVSGFMLEHALLPCCQLQWSKHTSELLQRATENHIKTRSDICIPDICSLV